MQRIKIGFWYNEHFPEMHNLPKPQENSATPEQVQQMLGILRNQIIPKATTLYCKGISLCRICGKMNYSGEYQYRHKEPGKPMVILQIPEGLEHYIEKHKVLVPELLQLNFPIQKLIKLNHERSSC